MDAFLRILFALERSNFSHEHGLQRDQGNIEAELSTTRYVLRGKSFEALEGNPLEEDILRSLLPIKGKEEETFYDAFFVSNQANQSFSQETNKKNWAHGGLFSTRECEKAL